MSLTTMIPASSDPVPATPASQLNETLRQMVAVLQSERQALAGLDLNGIMGCTYDKSALCGQLGDTDPDTIDDECRGLLDAARRLNEVNRQLRNLIAANVSARLDALTGGSAVYRASTSRTPAYAYTGGRG